MGWAQIISLVLLLIRTLRNSKSSQELAESVAFRKLDLDGQNLQWFWENREEILQFILKIVGMFWANAPQEMRHEVDQDVLEELTK